MTEPTDSTPDLRVELVSQARYLCGVRELVMSVADRYGFRDPERAKIALAVDEALANIIAHGYGRRPDGRIWLSLSPLPAPGGIRVILEDHAEQVDPGAIRGRDLDDIRPGGLGVHIIREVMDHVQYTRREGAGMRLVMEKRLMPPTDTTGGSP